MNPNDIELIYELSPMQQAMLFHSLYAPGTGIYVLQMSLRLTGRLDLAAFERAWRRIVERHGILRTAFFWEHMEKPAQVVYRQVALPLVRESWRGLPAKEQRERLDRFLDEDRARGFDLSEAPLMRLALIELAEGVHQLVWTQHHLVVDGWSQGQVLQELLGTYAALAAGREPQQEKARGFAEYIGWLRRQDLGQAESFWRASLAGLAEPTFIANGARNGHHRVEGPSVQDARRRDLTLSAETSAALREVARRHRLTLNTLVQGAWSLLLAQATGREDVVFGTTVAGRPADLPGVESIVGPFINTLPVRVEVRPEHRVREWLAALQTRQVAMRRVEHAPLVEVQRWSAVTPGTALFDHVLVFENLALPAELSRPLPDLEIVEEAASSLANYPLMVVALPGRDLTLSLRYDAGHFEDAQVARMLEHLAALLSALSEDRDTTLGELPLLRAEERHQVVVELNDTRSAFPREASLPALFAAVASATPDAPAVVEGDGETWSYRRLDEASSRLARHLREQGVAPGARVGVAMERSAGLIVALLGILKEGAAYVPLDPGLPEERRKFLEEDSGVSLVLSSVDTPRGASPSFDPLDLEIPAGSLAYVIYTSGSTGRPKGVAVSHRAIARLVLGTDYLTLRADDRLAFNATTSFDAATFEIWATLLHGGALVVISREELLAPAVLAERLERERVTVLHLTAAVFAQVAREAPEALRGPRCVLFGGEASAPAAVARALEAGRPRRLLQMYGPTESTTFATWQPITEIPPEATTVPIGRPLANTTAFVLDRWQRPAPLEQTGELFLGGEGLAWGYWNRPDLTAERFVPDPWSAEPGGRLYRTGDLVRRRANGVLEFQGRIDDQVKIRGFRVEPGEVEAVLASHPVVGECAVVVREGGAGELRLVAYVAEKAKDGTGFKDGKGTESLRSWLLERVPEYMVPSAWVFLQALPLTPNGKVDRKALPAPEPERAAEGSDLPADPVEELLAGIWSDVLGVARVGVHDDFFALGGHSLLATRVMSRVRGAFDVELPLRALFDVPTVAGLAQTVRALRSTRPVPPVVPVPRDGRDRPLSFAQQRLWFLDQLEPGSAAYNMPLAVRLHGAVEPELLARIFGEVVRRHEALRTTFAVHGQEPVQVIAPSWVPELEFLDLTPLPAEEREARARELAREEAERPFDLQRGPLLRLRLAQLDAAEWVLLVTMHHIVSDGWSMGVLLREIAALAEAFAQDRPSPLPELPVQYADFAVWQREWLRGEVLDEQIAYWKERLAGAPRLLELPTDRPRPAVQTSNGAARPVALPAATAAALREICREEGVTPFMALLGAWSAVLGRLAAQDDVVVGTPIAGRNRREIEDLIGFFVNTLVLRTDLAGRPDFRELLGRQRGLALDAFAHQDLPFERLVGELVPERDLSHAPLFQVLFAVQNAPVQNLSIPGLAFAPVPADSQIAKFDLELTLWEGGGGFLGALAYNTDLFDATTAQRLGDRFAAFLHAALADPERAVADLPLLLDGERQQVLAEANDTFAVYPREASVPERFAAMAAARPEAVAVIDADGTERSYGWLDEASGRLARHLARQGVAPGDRVGIAMERSADLVVAFLGILKAGAAYVPLDPAYPEERLAFMREDAGVGLILGPALPTIETPLGAPPAGPHIPADALAYVVYTSGSTGRPKGVAVSHRGILRLVHGADDLRLTSADRLAFNANTSFDAATYEIWATLLAGGTLVVIPQDLLLSPPDLAAVLRRHRVTVLHLTTALFNRVVREAPEVLATPSLRCALFGGEASDPGAVAQALAGTRPEHLLHMYGPTESTTFATFHAVRELASGAATVPIGRPLANTTAFLLDPAGAPVPLEAAGELFLGGDGLAWGYLNRPDLTAERFVPDAWSGAPGGRLYRTGDLVRRRVDGTLEFQGRIDNQVKIRGFRIEPGEIEAVLSEHPGVAACALLARKDGPGETRLVAYVVPQAGLTPETLREDLRKTLPDYMVPSAFVFLEALPLTPNGKVDRKALPAPERTLAAPGSGEPSTPAESVLAQVWAEVLGLERVGVHDNFFELGGDSILSIQVVSRARQAGLWLSPRDLFQNQTVAALAAVARTAPETAGDEEVAGEVPLTPIQRWFFDLDLQDLHHYNQALVLGLRERVEPGPLEQALAAVVARHTALRFRYVRDDEGWRQILGSDAPVPGLRSIDLSLLAAAERSAALEAVVAQLQAGFDVEHGPLLCAALFDLGEAGQRLFLAFHHLIVDGVSWRILLDDLGTAYRGGELPPVPTSFRRWAARQAESAGPVPDLDMLPLPLDRHTGADTVAAARHVVVELDEEATQALLRDVPPVYRTRIDDVLLTALFDAFSAWTGEPRLLVDLEGHGRDDQSGDVDLSRTVGWLTEIAPVLLEVDPRASDPAGDPGNRLKSVKEQLRAQRRGGRPAAQVVFNYLGQLDRGLPEGSLFVPAAESAGPSQSPRQARPWLLEVNGGVAGGRLRLTWTYSANRYDAATVQRLADGFLAALRELIEHCRTAEPGYTPSDFPQARVSRQDLDRLLAGLGPQRQEIESVYELSPMQQAMLFHSLYAPGSGVYVTQVSLRMTGRLDVDAFLRAWQRLVRRHDMLRTAFAWEGLEKPLQVVFRQAELEVQRASWAELDAAGQEARLAACLEADRERGFDLGSAPLLRLGLHELGPDDWRLVLSQHHILSDGWSQGLLFGELFTSYAALAAEREPALPAARPFQDYIGWLQRQDLAEAEAFWRQRLAGFESPTLLAAPEGSAAPAGFRAVRRRSGGISAAETTALRELGRRHRLTLNTLAQGAWAVALAQATGSNEVVFGNTVAGRPPELPGAESIFGLFINTLPVRAAVDPARGLLPWLAELQERQVEARHYEHAPLHQVQSWSSLAPGVALFDHILIFENHPLDAAMGQGMQGLALGEIAPSELTNYPLSVSLFPGADLRLEAIYDASRLDGAAVARLVERFETLLRAIAAVPEIALGALPMLRPEERHELLVELNDTAEPFPAHLCIHDLVAAQAARTPEAVAVSFQGEEVSYRELMRRAGSLAEQLEAMGVGPDVLVGLRMERSPALLAGLLGVLQAGGAYVPLDPGHPQERLDYIVEDAGVRVMVTEAGPHPLAPSPIAPPSAGRGGTRPGPENLAYVIYTSGSTGKPKGVGVRHGGVVNYLATMAARPGVSASDVVMAVTTLSFDIAVSELLLPLTVGARIELVSRETAGDAGLLAAALEAAGATVMQATPATWTLLVEGGWPGRPGLKALCGGEALPRALAEKLLARVGELWNVYGPTETTVWSARYRVESGDGAVPLGLPLGNTTIHLLGRQGELVPLGAAGELLIGGAGLARGYHGRPDLTAERFVPDPFGSSAERPGARLYRTGDLARRRPDGALEYLGRIDFQVKVRGFRIELGEIEAVLGSHSEVRECVVVARQEGGDVRLVAYLVPRAESAPSSGALRDHLRARLPEYMVPSFFVALESFPLTPSGKVDRKALPAPERSGADAEGYVAPSDPVEELLAGIWAEVLGLDRVGAQDHFFALGGHSLLGTRVVSRIRETFGVEVPLRRLFEAPTVAALAAVVRESREGVEAPPIVPVPRTQELPLSFAQQRLWLFDQLEPGSAAYNIPFAVRLRGEVDPGLLERVFAEIVRRHEVLRTTFAAHEGRPIQVIAPRLAPELPLSDLTHLPEAEREARARVLLRDEAQRPFDLQNGPLLRLGLIRIDPRDWILIVNMHHIVSDGWSQGVLLREIAALAEAFAEGRPSPLPELPVQYADFAVWQRGWLQGAVLQEQIDYWTRQLAGAPRVLELPTDRPRPAMQTFHGATLPFRLPARLAQAITALCRQEGVTPFMALLAAWSVLLGRHAGQDDLLVGSPVAGRNRREVEDLIGFFVNTLVLRSDLTGRPTFRELLVRVREAALGAFAHQDVPFERLVEELVQQRDLAVSPLFQVLFVLQNAPAGELRLPGVVLETVEADSEVAKFDLSLYLSETPEGYACGLEHNLDLFDCSTAARLVHRFTALLQGALADPGLTVGELPLLSDAELEQLRGWNETAEPFPADVCIHELVAAQAARTPEAVAVSCRGEQLSYRELMERSGRLAGELARMGVEPEVLVGLRMERTPALLVGMLGVLQAGGAYVPLDPTHPQERLDYIVEDAGVRVLVTDEGPHPLAPSPVKSPKTGGKALPENLAYVIYTSGSTGKPKGVGVRHGGVVNYLATMAQVPGVTADDVVVALTTLSFDIAVTELLLPLVVGARIELLGRETAGDAALLAAALESWGATVMQATPATWTLLVEGGWTGQPGLKALCGGEALPRALADKLLSRVGELWNVYGPTETTVWSTRHRVAPGDRQVSLGLPLGNTTIHLLGRWGELVPPGAAGELLIGGAGLARGYSGRPDLTAERFVPDPFGQPGDRLYRTGDLARRLPDGTLEYLGRIDFQVKVRGFRIELGEIESVLGSQAEVRECAVVARDGALVAYVVPRDGGELRTDELRAHLRARLPEYMVPSLFVAMDAFPLTPSGKVDRKALPAPDRSRSSAELVAPRTPTEEILVEMWKAVLNLDRVSVEDGFFELGGHSLLAAQLRARIRQTFGLDLPLAEIFRHPTVAGLAERIDAQTATVGAEEMAGLLEALAGLSDDEAQEGLSDPRGVLDRLAARERREEAESVPELVRQPRPEEGEAAFPLSFAQQRLWFLDQLEPGNPVYNIPLPVRLHGALPVARLERIFAEIVRRHEALRTTFAEGADEPVQIVHPELRPALPVFDLSHLPADEREETARRMAQEEAYRPFDLRTGPLLRLTAVRLEESEWLLIVTMHHIVSDGWSLGVLLREIAALFEADSAGRPSPLPELPVQYADFSVWQRQWLRGKVLEEQLSFWKRRLAGAPGVLELSTDRPRPAVQTYRGAAVTRFLAPEVSAAVRELCRRMDVTPFMALQAAWSLLLGRHAAQEDVVVGTPVAGRHRQETQDLIGFFVNTLALRTDLSGEPGFGALVERVSRASLEAFIHQDLPFERIVEELVAERDPSHAPLFQVMFAVQNATRQDLRLPGLTLSPVAVESRMAKFDLTLTLADGPEGFLGTLEHNTDLFDEGTAARLLARFEVLLAAATADPARPVAELPMMLPEERRQMLVEWNDSVLPPDAASFPELFAAVARAYPDEPAVLTADGEAWSYRRLDEASNRLARKLRALGVGPDQAVGICMERAPELILGVVAVLKAGGVYLPLNPANPDERLLFQLDDTKSGLVLVHQRTRGRLEGRRRLEVDPAAWSESRADADDRPLGVRVPSESLAYIIYTSGSTGLPKGVGVPHAAAMIHSAVIVEDDALRPGERVIQFSSLSFDVSLEQMLPTLISGAAVVLRDEELANPDEMLRGFARLGVTSANLPTVYWHQAVQSWTAASAPPQPLRLRVQCVGGEAMLPEAARRWMALAEPLRLRGVRLINGYGPTETVVTATRFTVPDVIPPNATSVSIGRTLPYRVGFVVDSRGNLQPVGVPGELCLGGVMARGYVNRPELTAEKFVPNPWSGEPGARLYRTGDLVRQLPGGEIDYLGRIDRQVKIRGFRIEPGEIEAVLSALPQVRDCAVLARRDTPGETRLVAYVVPALGASLSAMTVRELLREKLPDYMVPAAVVFLEALPLTPNGKVDRKALPAPDRSLAPEEGFVPPRDEIELRVAALWEELLDVRPVGLHDNFFALGGHSLLALRLVGSIERQLGSRIPLAALIAAPTVETIARLVREEVSLPRSLVVPLEPGPTSKAAAAAEAPLFLVHPVGGNVFCYLPLARLGDLGVPVYGIQAPEPEADAAWTLESLAARYVAAVREIRPAGPYRLAGWSLGGALAYEMARQLEAEGSAVDLLALIDPGPPRQGGEEADPRLELAQFVHDLRGLAGFDTAQPVALPAGAETLDDLLGRPEVRELLPPDVTEEQIRSLFVLFRANTRALAAYRPEAYAGRLTLLRAEATAALLPEADRAWSALAGGGAEVHRLAGDHYSLLRPPHVAALSQVLAARLHGPEGLMSKGVAVEAAGAGLSPVKRQLLQALLRAKRAAAVEAETIRPRENPEAPAPLSFAQERMWFLYLLAPEASAYNVVNAVAMEGDLRPDLLADAFRLLIRRHEILATRYAMDGNNQPVQVVEPDAPFRLRSVDLSALPEEERARELSRLETEEAYRPFDLVRGPVLRVTLVRLAPAEHVMVLALHHIAIDGWSMGILVQDLAALYGGLVAGTPAQLPAPRLQYADFAVWQRRWLRGATLERYLAFWRRQLETPLPVLMLPTDLPRQVPQTFLPGTEEMILPARLATDLLALGRTHGASLFMALLAGLTAVLHRASGDERIMVGSPVAGRDRGDVQQLIGFFLNNLVLRVDLDGDPGFGAHLERAARTSLDAFAHQDLPLETLLQELRLEREGGGARGPFQAMLLLQNVPPSRFQVPGLTLSSHGADWGEGAGMDVGAAIFEVGLTVSEAGDGALHAAMAYNALLFEPVTVRRLLSHLRVLLEGGVADPGARLSELPLLSAAEQGEVLAWGLELRDVATFGAVGDFVDPGQPAQAHVVDRALRPVPVGIPGEVLLGGPGVAPGDLGAPGLTAERLIPDPFSGVAGARLVRTGDLARRRADGSLEFAGRIDQQVRIRGFRVEPWKVEAELAASPEVAECAVMVRAGGPEGQRLVAYVVPAPGSKSSTAELRAFLDERLPAWLVPSAFVALPALPRTPAGRIDLAALPEADAPSAAAERPLVEPRNEIEEIIAEIWREALHVDQLSVFDGFFELGGHSLLLLQVLRRLSDAFELEIPLRSIYEERTVAALAKKVEELLIAEVQANP